MMRFALSTLAAAGELAALGLLLAAIALLAA